MMNSSPFKSSLFWVSIIVIIAAAWLWNGRMERRHELRLARQEQQSQRKAQQAAALLFRAFRADNYLTYSALSQTKARMGQSQIESVARIIHAPSRLSIVYVKGDYAGLQSGYNGQLAWRQVSNSQQMIPYAEMERPAIDMAARRFALLLQNYEVNHRGRMQLQGRNVEVVELRPFHPVEGARGPAKKLWIDTETGLTLRQKTFNHQMMPVMESVLSEVNFTPQIADGTFVRPEELQQAAQQRPWMAHDVGADAERIARLAGVYPPQPEAERLPAGFKFDSFGAHRCTSSHHSKAAIDCYAALSRYSDGLNTLTIFALKSECGLNGGLKSTRDEKNTENLKSNSGAGSASAGGASANTCQFGTGTLAMRSTNEGQLVAVSDLPAPVLQHTLEATTVRLYPVGRN